MAIRRNRHLARSILLCAASGFLVLIVGLSVALERFHPQLYDVEHVSRMRLLKERLAENPNRPLWLALGTSRLGLAFLPELLPTYSTPDGREVLVFNFSHLGSSPAMHWMQLHRLFAEGIRPDWVMLDLVPVHLVPRDDNFVSHHVGARDLLVLHPHMQMRKLYGRYFLRTIEMAPRYPAYLLGIDPEPSFDLDRLGGYKGLHESVDDPTRQEKTKSTRKFLGDFASDFHISPRPARLLHKCIKFCQDRGVKVGLILMPEGTELRSWYSQKGQMMLDELLAGLRSRGVQVIDARTWLEDGDFYDQHHVLQHGAEKFTARFGKDVLAPLLTGTEASRP